MDRSSPFSYFLFLSSFTEDYYDFINEGTHMFFLLYSFFFYLRIYKEIEDNVNLLFGELHFQDYFESVNGLLAKHLGLYSQPQVHNLFTLEDLRLGY